MEMQRTLDGKPADTYVGISIARDGANPRIIEYYAQLVKNLRGSNTRKIFPITESRGLSNEEEPTVYCIDANYYKGPAKQSRSMIQQLNNPVHSNNRIYDPEGLAPAINCAEDGNRQPFILCDSGQGRKNQLRNETIAPLRANTEAGHNNIVCHSTLPRNSTSGTRGTGHLQRDDDLSYCCDAANNIAVEVNQQIRRLTPIECERLQGFPDNWTEGISDTQRYKCLGNAVTVNVIEFISLHIKEMLLNKDA